MDAIAYDGKQTRLISLFCATLCGQTQTGMDVNTKQRTHLNAGTEVKASIKPTVTMARNFITPDGSRRVTRTEHGRFNLGRELREDTTVQLLGQISVKKQLFHR